MVKDEPYGKLYSFRLSIFNLNVTDHGLHNIIIISVHIQNVNTFVVFVDI